MNAKTHILRYIIMSIAALLVLYTLYLNVNGVLTFQNDMSLGLGVKVFFRLGFNLLPLYSIGALMFILSYKNKQKYEK